MLLGTGAYGPDRLRLPRPPASAAFSAVIAIFALMLFKPQLW